MPLYEYRCARGHISERFVPMAQCRVPTMCEACGEVAQRIISRVGFAMPDIAPYRSIVTGEEISSRSKHREHLKRHDLIELGNEKMPKRDRFAPPPGLVDDIKRAIETTGRK